MKRTQELILIIALIVALITIGYKASQPVVLDADTLSRLQSDQKDIGTKGQYIPMLLLQQAGFISTLLLLPLGLVYLKNKSVSNRLTARQDRFQIINRHYKARSLAKNLLREFPKLTSNELLLCEMLLEMLSSKEIATKLHITPASVNTARYRLRKKMQVPAHVELITFLDQYRP